MGPFDKAMGIDVKELVSVAVQLLRLTTNYLDVGMEPDDGGWMMAAGRSRSRKSQAVRQLTAYAYRACSGASRS